MLLELSIHNFILIDDLHLEFAPGINILSGETGAGKSIIVDALGMALGDRMGSSIIRDMSRKALVEAVFDVSHNQAAQLYLTGQDLIDADDEDIVILSREIHPNGRTAGRINRRSVTAAVLKTLSTYLVDIHLQSDRQNILQPTNFLEYVDRFAVDLGELPQQVASLHRRLADKKRELATQTANHQDRLQRQDFLAYQIKEIESSRLRPGEEEELKQMRDRIRDSARLMTASTRMLELLYMADSGPSAYDQVASALDIAADFRQDSFFAALREPMENIYYSLQDLCHRLSDFKSKLEFEPGQLEECEDRLYVINKLKNKYGDTIDAILAYGEKARRESQALEKGEELLKELSAEIEGLHQQYLLRAEALHQKRQDSAKILERMVHQELLDLGMPNLRFAVPITKTAETSPHGSDRAEFLFSPNPGAEMKPIAHSASGGEISRFILALKKALAQVYSIPTLIFDEIDAGLGGAALNAVARKLAGLSLDHQLILVTHAPQIACYGARNMVIEKYVEQQQTFTRVRVLDQEEKVRELARMLDGDDYTELTLHHAREMICQADLALNPPV